jgi:hemoglobin
MSLYEDIGGKAAVDQAVFLFHAKLVADPLLGRFFDHLSQDEYYRKQSWFLTTVLKGETVGADSYMRMTHRKLVRKQGLTDVHFEAVTNHLRASLEELGLPDHQVAEIVEAANSLKDAVLDR